MAPLVPPSRTSRRDRSVASIEQDRPFALHITWTCYGTWIPGDRRGYVSNTLRADGSFLPRQNTPGTPYTADDARTRRRAQALQKHPTVRLTIQQARCVAESLLAAASDRDWRILRAAILSNHVHVVLTDCPDDGPAVRRVLKGVTQAALSRLASRGVDPLGGPRRWWTKGGSDRYKHDASAIEAAVRYVARHAEFLSAIDNMQMILPPPQDK